MIKIVEGDLLAGSEYLIGHQVNCQGAMGSGIAKQIRGRYPQVYDSYAAYCRAQKPEQLLGRCQFVEADNRIVANLFGQLHYGRQAKRYTDYEALSRALRTFKEYAQETGAACALPYMIGCGLANGEWHVVENRLQDIFSDYLLTLYRYGG